ncbi:acyl-CoA dehydrogenase family protein [Actinoplanes siamensis]|uniref:Dibenzothiophene monooxygenase n=1 Tax=Actinoplanes siamensis TaxID=1223317 RepID=A0A919N5S7_9ACTN|nr:acyl-CoA dehydrogenase family protein [Actinoplanes siamensis]GIF04844.1 SfnB family sulfur acquisition oxidoreductase [Actinoplanes siamensis]
MTIIESSSPVRIAEQLRDEFRAGAAERDRNRQFPYEQCAAFRDSGLLGLMVPREHGGHGGSFVELTKVVIAISAGDSNIGQMYQLHTGGIRLLQEFASPAVQAKWLPRFTRELWITNAYSEVGTKSVNDFNTTVTPDGDGWRLNGRKFYCTGSLAGDITFGPCRVAGSDEVRVFFARTDAEGVTIHDDWSGFGQRTTASGTTEFDNVWVPGELCFGSPDSAGGGGGAITSLNYQVVHTGVFVGIARNALDDAVEFVRTKSRLWYESSADRATDDLYTQLRVGEMKTAVDAAELLALRAAELCDRAVDNPGDERIRGEASVVTGQAREAAASAAMYAGSTLFKVCGAGSVLEKYGLDRHWRNARTLSLHNPLDFKSMHAGDYLLNDRLPPVDSYN